MAHGVPGTVSAPDVGLLISGRDLTASALAPLGSCANYAAAHVGSGTPRIAQTWARRGNTTKAPLWTVTGDHAVASWSVPGTRGATAGRRSSTS